MEIYRILMMKFDEFDLGLIQSLNQKRRIGVIVLYVWRNSWAGTDDLTLCGKACGGTRWLKGEDVV